MDLGLDDDDDDEAAEAVEGGSATRIGEGSPFVSMTHTGHVSWHFFQHSSHEKIVHF